MTTNNVETIRHLARWVCSLRDWNEAAVTAELWKLRHHGPALLALAATLAALDPDIATPAGIGFTDRTHWQRAQQAVNPEQLADDTARQRHHQLRHQIAQERANRATPDQIRTIRAAARQRIQECR